MKSLFALTMLCLWVCVSSLGAQSLPIEEMKRDKTYVDPLYSGQLDLYRNSKEASEWPRFKSTPIENTLVLNPDHVLTPATLNTIQFKNQKAFSYHLFQYFGYKDPFSSSYFNEKFIEFLLHGIPDVTYDDGELVDDGDEWSFKDNLNLYNCHSYAFKNIVKVTPYDWLDGQNQSSYYKQYGNPVEKILKHRCHTLMNPWSTKDPAINSTIHSVVALHERKKSSGELIMLFSNNNTDAESGIQERVYFHSGKPFMKDGTVFVQSKLGQSYVTNLFLISLVQGYKEVQKVISNTEDFDVSIELCKTLDDD